MDLTDSEGLVINLDLSAFTNGVITAPTEIKGTVSDPNLDYYSLEVAPLGSDAFTEVFRGTQSVTDGILGKFDPSTLVNDTYTLRLSAYDINGQGSMIEDTLSATSQVI